MKFLLTQIDFEKLNRNEPYRRELATVGTAEVAAVFALALVRRHEAKDIGVNIRLKTPRRAACCLYDVTVYQQSNLREKDVAEKCAEMVKKFQADRMAAKARMTFYDRYLPPNSFDHRERTRIFQILIRDKKLSASIHAADWMDAATRAAELGLPQVNPSDAGKTLPTEK